MFAMRNDSCPLCKDDYREYVSDLKAYADLLDIPFVQGHAPFPAYDYTDKAYSERIFPFIIRSIEIAGMLGIKHLVIHPIVYSQNNPDYDLKEVNMNLYRKLLPYAKEYGVQICTENIFAWNEEAQAPSYDLCSGAKALANYIDTIDDEYFGACLDIGHTALFDESPEIFIKTLGRDRIKALHVHDNDGCTDQHRLPFYGSLKWEEITKALSDIKYDGNFTFEADAVLSPLPADKEVYSSALKFMHDVGRYMVSKIKTR